MNKEIDEKIIAHYQKGQGSIQDIARVYNVPVSYVLELTGQGHLARVQTSGDLIDLSEAGPNAQMNYGKDFIVPFTVD